MVLLRFTYFGGVLLYMTFQTVQNANTKQLTCILPSAPNIYLVYKSQKGRIYCLLLKQALDCRYLEPLISSGGV